MAQHGLLKPSTGFPIALALGLASIAVPSVAQAHGFVGFGFSFPLVIGGPPAYYPPPAYTYPGSPPVVATAPAAPAASYCREYQATSTIDGRPQRVYGTACRQADGSWRILSQQGP